MKKLLFSLLLIAGYSVSAFAQCDLEVKKYSNVLSSDIIDCCFSVPGYLFVLGNTEFTSNDEVKRYVLGKVEGVEQCLEWEEAQRKFTCIKISLDKVKDAYDILMKDDKISSVRNVFFRKDFVKENLDVCDSKTFERNALCYGNEFVFDLALADGDWPDINNRDSHPEIDSIMTKYDLTEESKGFFYHYFCKKDANLFDVCNEIVETEWSTGASLVSYYPYPKAIFFSPTLVKSAENESGLKVTYYNLNGQPVQSPAHSGIIIGDGRKMIVE